MSPARWREDAMALPSLTLWFGDLADDDASRAWRAGRRGRLAPPSNVSDHDALSSTDRAIVARIRTGDERTYVSLYESYMQPLAQFALHLTGDPAVAEEVTAHVLSAVWLRRERWVVRDGIDAYLFGAVRNRVLTLRHAAARHDRIERTLALDERSPTLGAGPHPPDAVFDASEWPERLQSAMAALPERYRHVAFLRWKRGLEYHQIGQVLGISEATARQLVSRSLRTLRAILGI